MFDYRKAFGCQIIAGLIATSSYASPLLVTIGTGPNTVLEGVTKSTDGTAYLVGYQIDPTTQAQSGVLVSIAPNMNTPVITPLASPAGGGSVYVNGISGDYIVGGSVINAQTTRGLVWRLSDPSATPAVIAPAAGQGSSDTFLYGVNSSGEFAGTGDRGHFAISGQVGGVTTVLSAPAETSAFATQVSETGTLVGEIANSQQNTLSATVWTDTGDVLTLANPSVLAGGISQEAAAYSISVQNTLIGGFIGVFDKQSEEIEDQAAVWSGPQWENLTLLQDASGDPLFGRVLGVTDDGYAVGTSNEGGFIWHTGWESAQLFNDWALGEFGISIPTWVTSVNDIYSNGTDLSFALQGSAYYFNAPLPASSVPEPTTFVMLFASILVVTMCPRRRSLPWNA